MPSLVALPAGHVGCDATVSCHCCWPVAWSLPVPLPAPHLPLLALQGSVWLQWAAGGEAAAGLRGLRAPEPCYLFLHSQHYEHACNSRPCNLVAGARFEQMKTHTSLPGAATFCLGGLPRQEHSCAVRSADMSCATWISDQGHI